MIGRRQFIQTAGLGMAAIGLPIASFARVPTDTRFVLVILRGAVDGLALCAPYGDGHYSRARGELALAPPGSGDGLRKLDGLFGLHPSLPGIHRDYVNGDALIVHGVASPYRERSHFDGQDVLENGGTKVGLMRDGWLNRALASIGSSIGDEAAIAMSQNTPLVLRGANSVTSWAPSQLPDAADDTIERLQMLYADDEFFATRLAQALDAQSIAAGSGEMPNGRGRRGDAERVKTMMSSAANFLTAADGPRIAVLEAGGWDTHANQGGATGQLANRFAALDDGLSALRDGMGSTWTKTVVAVVTEFGRTVRVNGTRGTDHGTGTAAILTGGAVNGGRVVTDWPGLRDRDLYQGRDLKPTVDIRSVFKGILIDHLGVSESSVDSTVFPQSRSLEVADNLIAT